MIRLQKYIASSGITSRRKAEELIVTGRVFVNGKAVTQLGTSVDPEVDTVMVDGQPVKPAATFRYIAFNKPVGVVSTRAQYQGEKTVYDIVPDARGLVLAGRLDKDSEGLVLLTNDGELVDTLTHPRYQHEKEYEVTLTQAQDEAALNALRAGILLPEGTAVFDHLEQVGPVTYRIIIHQGWKRQIRRMFAQVHAHVVRLVRVRINKLQLGDLPTGEWRSVERSEIL